jgi:hypothetical protein
MERIEAGLLIPGVGSPVRDGVVLVDSGRISYAGPANVVGVWTGRQQVKGSPAAWPAAGADRPRSARLWR